MDWYFLRLRLYIIQYIAQRCNNNSGVVMTRHFIFFIFKWHQVSWRRNQYLFVESLKRICYVGYWKIRLFDNQKIRTVWLEEEEEWYFSVKDVVTILTETTNAKDYISRGQIVHPPLKISPWKQVRYSAKINVFDAILAGYRAFFVKTLSLKKKTKSILSDIGWLIFIKNRTNRL